MYVSKSTPMLDGLDARERSELYYETQELNVSKVEVQKNIGRTLISSNSLAFGSTSSFVIPNHNLIRSCYLVVTLQDKIAGELTIPGAWLFSLIDSITYTFGPANVSQIKMSGKSLLAVLLADSEHRSKKEEILQSAGDAYQRTQGSSFDITGSVLLKLPWNSLKGKKPFDASILSSPIHIDISFKQSSAIYGIGDSGTVTNFPNTMKSIQLVIEEFVLSDRSNSIKKSIMADPSLMYSYPYMHFQSGSIKRFTGAPDTTTFSIELQELLNADLLAIHFGVFADKYETPPDTAAVVPKLAGVRLLNVKLTYNGQVLQHFPGNLIELDQLVNGGGSWSIIPTLNEDGTAGTTSLRNYSYSIYFTPHQVSSFMASFSNTPRLPSQTLLLEFIIASDDDATRLKLPSTDPNTKFSLHYTYQYPAVNSVSQGSSNLMFN